MTMSTSSAPASTAARTSAILMSRNVWPDGNPVATLATLTVEPLERVLRLGDERRVDAHRGDGRDRRVARLRAHRLDAHRPDLARRVLSLEGRQVHHRDRELERPQLRRLLDRAPLERIDPLLDADLVDRGDPPEQAAERPGTAVPGTDQLVGALTGRVIGASRGGHGTERIHPVRNVASERRRPLLAPAVDLGEWRQAALAVDQEVAEPRPRRCAGSRPAGRASRSASARGSPRGRAAGGPAGGASEGP